MQTHGSVYFCTQPAHRQPFAYSLHSDFSSNQPAGQVGAFAVLQIKCATARRCFLKPAEEPYSYLYQWKPLSHVSFLTRRRYHANLFSHETESTPLPSANRSR